MAWKVVAGFFRGLWSLAWPWRLWVGLLVLLNGVLPLYFWDALEARVVLAALLLGALIQLAVFRARGFVRLLGIGHLAVWTPMLVWLWRRLADIGTADLLGRWLLAVIVIDAASWLIDLADVVRYALGDNAATLTLEDLE